MFTETLKEAFTLCEPAHPRSTNAAISTGVIDASKFHRIMFIGSLGTKGTASNVAFVIQESAEASGANAVNVSGATSNTLATANNHVTLELRTTQITVGRPYIICTSIPGGANASVVAIYGIAAIPHYKPQSADHASWVQRLVKAAAG